VCGDYLSFLSNSKEPFGPISKKKLETHLWISCPSLINCWVTVVK
jgi:hypothetical protein